MKFTHRNNKYHVSNVSKALNLNTGLKKVYHIETEENSVKVIRRALEKYFKLYLDDQSWDYARWIHECTISNYRNDVVSHAYHTIGFGDNGIVSYTINNPENI